MNAFAFLVNGRRMISRVAFGLAVWMASAGVGRSGELDWSGGTYAGWPTWPSGWTAINSLNDGDDLQKTNDPQQLDFVGDASDPGAYWAQDSNFIYFRVRVDFADTVTKGPPPTFNDTVHVLIDSDLDIAPNYGFSWDSNQPVATHGLEMTKYDKGSGTWDAIEMADVDNLPADRGTADINGLIGGSTYRTGEGYVRTIDQQLTTNFGMTTFIDYAVKWNYLTGYSGTGLASGQTWRIALARISHHI